MRTRLLSLAWLAAVACRPPVVTPPDRPPVADAGPVVALEPPPEAAPEPEPAPDPPPTWAWAVSVLPALAEHSEVDPSVAALARFLKWFADGKPPRVHVLLEGACHGIDGSLSEDGFHGGWRRQVTREGDERRVTGMSLDITRGGISESGPGGVIYTRDRRGRWQESGGFGTGWFGMLVDHPMTAADDRSVTFAGYTYRLEPVCERTEAVTQTCTDGAQRKCEQCTGVWLKPRADRMAWGTTKIKIGRVESTPVDCSQPCPADEWTPLLPRLSAVLKGREFAGVLAEGPVVFRGAKDCAQGLRQRKAAEAAARKADERAAREPT